MTSLTMYKGVTFDGVNSFPHITSKETFDAYLAGKQQYSQGIHYNRIGEPILINEGYDTAIGYSYGCIVTGNKKYFIIPDSISVNENNRVYMSYSVDWYTTLMYDDALTFGRAHLIKSTDVDPLTYPQGIQPSDMMITSKTYVGDHPLNGNGGMVVSYVKDDAVNFIFSPTKNFMSAGSTIEAELTLSPANLYDGSFFALTGILPADIINAWYIPFNFMYGTWTTKDNTLDGIIYTWKETDYGLMWGAIVDSVNTNITTDNMRKGVITDRSGNIVYVVPYGRTLTKIGYGQALSTTQCYIVLSLTFEGQSSTELPDKNVENATVLIPCDKIDYINSTYLNWTMGMKGVEIEERRIQRNKALVGSIGNAALGGAIGASGGSPVGAGIGAIGGIASGLLSYGVDTYYESDIQRIEDQKYRLAQDEIIPGSLLPNSGYTITAYQLSASDEDIARYTAEISNFGADCNLPVSSWTPSIGAYKFADVEVIADVPYGIKQNIKQKMMSGIKIVGVS